MEEEEVSYPYSPMRRWIKIGSGMMLAWVGLAGGFTAINAFEHPGDTAPAKNEPAAQKSEGRLFSEQRVSQTSEGDNVTPEFEAGLGLLAVAGAVAYRRRSLARTKGPVMQARLDGSHERTCLTADEQDDYYRISVETSRDDMPPHAY